MQRTTRFPSLSPRHAVPLALALFFLLAGAACSGGSSSPTEPNGVSAPISASAIMTAHGMVRVETNGHLFDPAAAEAAIERGYDKARAQIGSYADNFSVDGLLLIVHAGPFDGAVGRYRSSDDVIEMAEGVENVLSHELQHRFCHQLGRDSECCRLQDHPGGYDLLCDPR